MQTSNFTKGLSTVALALSLVACSDSSSGDYGASGLIDPSTTTTTTGGGSTGNSTKITANANSITAVAESTPVAVTVSFTVDDEALSQVYVRVDDTSYEGLSSAAVSTTGTHTAELELVYQTNSALAAGSYDDSVEVQFCEDADCNSPIEGSPYTVGSTLMVNVVSSTGAEPLLLKEQDRKTIDTDLFAATFVKSVGLFVAAVNSNPNELDNRPQTVIFIDPETGTKGLVGYTQDEIISISSDNTGVTPRVVAGHANGLVTVFEYNESTPAASFNSVLNTGEALGQVAVNGTDVFAIPAAGGNDVIRRIDLSTNEYAEYAGVEVPAGSTMTAHAGGDRVYVASSAANGLIQNLDVSGGTINLMGDSASTGVSDTCGGIWSSADSDKLVSGCGDVFSANSNAALDLVLQGNISQPTVNPLKADQRIYWFADSVSNSSEMLTLSVANGCSLTDRCARTLSFYGKNNYEHRISRTFGSYLAADNEPIRLEQPVAAAYSEDGSKVYVLTRLYEELRLGTGELAYDTDHAYVHIINR
ncbi:MAG: hypothetical protein ACPGSC_07150 [Granulosicoccaceae bacterium]